MSTYGRYLKRALSLLVTDIKREEKLRTQQKQEYKIQDIDKIINITNTLSRASNALTKLADVADHDKRIKNLEYMFEQYTPKQLAEMKSKLGN